MKIQHIRNASSVVHIREHCVLIDPCLGPKSSLPPYTILRKRPRLNPIVDLPANADSILRQTTAALITHCRNGHADHLDRAGIRLLAQRELPTYCNERDARFLRKRGINAVPLVMDQKNEFLGGTITPFPTAHGRGLIGKLMGQGTGYFIERSDDKSLYLSGDTVMNQTVRHVLLDLKPDISILNAGTATLDLGKPILMPLDELIEFITIAPGKVVAVHMDAFNHCLTSRDRLKEAASKKGLSDKVIIPSDGEAIVL